MTIRIIGGGLAGSEAAWQIARRGFPVEIYEMRPNQTTKAHKSDKLAELVCSNSFRGVALSNAVGLLKAELRFLSSLIMDAADRASVPAGGALAVDREVFSSYVTQKLENNPLISIVRQQITTIPEVTAECPLIIATGPLTSPALARCIEELTGRGQLAFFDAISPIVTYDSIDLDIAFKQSRYDKGGNDYLNLPLSKEDYYALVEAIAAGEKFGGHDEVEGDKVDDLRPFEGCMPVEEMVARGKDTLAFGPLKPVGLVDPKTGKRPFAVIQLRQDDRQGRLWSMVGFQTRLRHGEQTRIFRTIPGLSNAEFVRLGSVHRNTFIDSPKCLNSTLEYRTQPGLFFAGQVTGTEGYVESTAGGLVAGWNACRLVQGLGAMPFPNDSAIGALMNYISDPTRQHFQPMNISFGLMPSYFEGQAGEKRYKSKADRRLSTANRALQSIENFAATHG